MTQLASSGGDTAGDQDRGSTGITRAPEPYELTDAAGPLDREVLRSIDAWWRAANYLSVGQIYLTANPLLREPLQAEHVKPRLLGHFGTVPGLNLVYAHANRAIRERDLNAVFIAGPGHGGPGPNACAWLEGTYSELYSHTTTDIEGMAAFFRQFSYPGGVPSHCAPETPGSFHEGGELGYSLLHAFGAALNRPNLVVFCVVLSIGVHLVGYAEFDTVRQLMFTGTFRHILNAKLYVDATRQRVAASVHPDDYWHVVRDVSREFGCTHVRLSLAGSVFEERNESVDANRCCAIRVPFANGGYVSFGYPTEYLILDLRERRRACLGYAG